MVVSAHLAPVHKLNLTQARTFKTIDEVLRCKQGLVPVRIGVFALGGHWLDGRLGSDPWLLILGVFVGFALGLVSLVSKLSPHGGARKPNDDSHPKPEDPR